MKTVVLELGALLAGAIYSISRDNEFTRQFQNGRGGWTTDFVRQYLSGRGNIPPTAVESGSSQADPYLLNDSY